MLIFYSFAPNNWLTLKLEIYNDSPEPEVPPLQRKNTGWENPYFQLDISIKNYSLMLQEKITEIDSIS